MVPSALLPRFSVDIIGAPIARPASIVRIFRKAAVLAPALYVSDRA